MADTIVTYRGVAHTWLCDHLGHLNTRHYVGMFDDAMQHFFHLLGHEPSQNLGWADVKHIIEYQKEVPVGSLVRIECGVLRIGTKSITYRQNMILCDSGEICATNDATTVLFDTEIKKAVVLPQKLVNNGKNHLIL